MDLERVKQSLLTLGDLNHYSNVQLKDAIYDVVEQLTQKDQVSYDAYEKHQLVMQTYQQLRGYGIIEHLLGDDTITEIMINRFDLIFIERNGVVEKTALAFDSVEQLYDVIQKMVNQAGREVNYANPIVDVRLEDGSRVNVVLAPISLKGAVVTIRKFSKEPLTMDKLKQLGALDESLHAFLKEAIVSKQNILISGGTGTGKTTFLNALSQFIPSKERIITIEDAAELQLIDKDNLIVLQTRRANSAKAGEITIRDLIKTALRMRPERIIVGEVRGQEALDMLQAMNTGHAGSMSTLHANSAYDVISRLETMIIMATENMPLLAIRQQIVSSVQLIIHLTRTEGGKRYVQSIHQVMALNGDKVTLQPLFERKEV